MPSLGGAGLLALDKLVLNSAHDRGVAHCTVVHGDTVNHSDGVEQPASLDLSHELGVLRPDIVRVQVAVEHLGVVAVAALDLGADDCCDLLWRPRRASTSGEAVGGRGNVEYLNDDGFSHVRPPTRAGQRP